MPTPATVTHAPHWVSYGPPNTSGGASDWCIIDNPEPQHLAPGGVVLCVQGTNQLLHPEAKRYAQEAWAIYGRYLADITPALAVGWVPEPVTIPGIKVQWKQTGRRVSSNRLAPDGWLLMAIPTETHQYVHYNAKYYAEVEWATFAKTHAGSGKDNLRARGSWSAAPVWLPPIPVLTDVIVRGANKHTRRAITTKADRAAGEKNIKRPAAVGAA